MRLNSKVNFFFANWLILVVSLFVSRLKVRRSNPGYASHLFFSNNSHRIFLRASISLCRHHPMQNMRMSWILSPRKFYYLKVSFKFSTACYSYFISQKKKKIRERVCEWVKENDWVIRHTLSLSSNIRVGDFSVNNL